jgi:hypothetical protein
LQGLTLKVCQEKDTNYTKKKEKEISVLYETLLGINVILGRILKNGDSSRDKKSLQKASINCLVSLKLMV